MTKTKHRARLNFDEIDLLLATINLNPIARYSMTSHSTNRG